VQKKDGSLRMCIDYRALNTITERDRYPLPRINDLLDKLHGCTIFSFLDLQSSYHQIRLKYEDKPNTAVMNPMGQYKFQVLCYGLTNALATFQRVKKVKKCKHRSSGCSYTGTDTSSHVAAPQDAPFRKGRPAPTRKGRQHQQAPTRKARQPKK
jgi:hypothetical protein